MAVLPLVIAPDERLNLPSAKVAVVDQVVRQLVRDMFETMNANHGIGLAAVQVGVHQRIIVIDIGASTSRYENEHNESNPLVFINPEIVHASKEMKLFAEGCLSFPEHYSDVERPAEVTVEYLDIDGKTQRLEAKGLLATCLQHEIDHINGIVFVDHVSALKRDMILRKLKKAKRFGVIEPLEQKQEQPL